MYRVGLRRILEETGRMTVVGETDSVEEAVQLSRRLDADVLAIDLGMLRGSGLRTIRKRRAREQETKVLVLTAPEHLESLDPIIDAGVKGCIGTNRTAEELVIAVDLVAAGGMRFPRRASRLVHRRIQDHGSGLQALLATLNEKELRVLALTARGFTAREIGVQIRRAAKTVENYRSAIRRKLGIKTRADFVSVALETGLLDMDLSPST